MTITSIGSNYTAVNQSTKKTKDKTNKGSVRALMAGNVASAATAPISLVAAKGLENVPKSLTTQEIAAINDAAANVLNTTGLAAKGVKIHNIQNGGINLSGLPDSLWDMVNPYSAIANGKNAAFSPKPIKNQLTGQILHDANSILINKDKLPTAVFHEMGHAFNYNSSAIWKVIQKMRMPSMVIASGLMLYSAFSKNSEAKEGEELTKKQKVNNFVRKNSHWLAAGAMVPVVLEESMASIRGCKWANANLAKDLAKKVTTSNLFGAASYIAAAAGMGIAAFAATKVKDKIVEKAKQKELEKAQQAQIAIA